MTAMLLRPDGDEDAMEDPVAEPADGRDDAERGERPQFPRVPRRPREPREPRVADVRDDEADTEQHARREHRTEAEEVAQPDRLAATYQWLVQSHTVAFPFPHESSPAAPLRHVRHGRPHP